MQPKYLCFIVAGKTRIQDDRHSTREGALNWLRHMEAARANGGLGSLWRFCIEKPAVLGVK